MRRDTCNNSDNDNERVKVLEEELQYEETGEDK